MHVLDVARKKVINLVDRALPDSVYRMNLGINLFLLPQDLSLANHHTVITHTVARWDSYLGRTNKLPELCFSFTEFS